MKHCWTDEERDIIRRDYRQTHASRNEIARRLGVTENAVTGQIAKMGIAKRSDRHPWTPEEDEKLADFIHRYCPSTVAHKMGRGINSVVVRSKRLGHHRRVRDGWFIKLEVCEILGKDHKWLQKRIDSGQLKATWHTEVKPQQKGGACWHIDEGDLIAFIRRYPQDLTGRNVDLITIVDLLAGII